MADRMVELAEKQPGFLGVESARNELGITVSYWNDLASIKAWKQHAEHTIAHKKAEISGINTTKPELQKWNATMDLIRKLSQHSSRMESAKVH